MRKTERKTKMGNKAKVVLKDLEVGKVKGGVEVVDPKGGAQIDVFPKQQIVITKTTDKATSKY